LPGLREFLDSVHYVQLGSVRHDTATQVLAQTRPSSGTHCHVVTQQQCTSGMSGGFGGTMTPTYNCLPVSKTICD